MGSTRGLRAASDYFPRVAWARKPPSKKAVAKMMATKAKVREAQVALIVNYIESARRQRLKFDKKILLWRACFEATGIKTSTVESLIRENEQEMAKHKIHELEG